MRTALVVFAFCAAALAQIWQTKFPSAEGWTPLINGTNLEGWRPLDSSKPNTWEVAKFVWIDPHDPRLIAMQRLTLQDLQVGTLMNGRPGKTVNLIRDQKHGDVEAYIEFLIPKGSNSGVYFQGLYEIQILDSYGKTELSFSDCGGIYARYIDQKVVGGTPPRVNASKSAGAWQSFHVWFRAPRFDSAGRKTENARFVKVIHNDKVIHENVEVDGPTRASMTTPEAPTGPLMLQGDHGPVAYRNIHIRPLR